ncbi:MAG: mechanosensitive ion channel family protein [Oscillospiraceae bacterium]|nr:mechanosensitive ion channel family protein [Oscillospiraceae bacterium]MDE7170488.1 mechanosensitive ion channel family protein [Oscillospiraceae bacterium]
MPPVILTGVLSGDAAEGLLENISKLTANKVFGAVIAAVVCLVVIKILTKVTARALSRSKLDTPLQTLLRNLLKGVLWFITVIIVLGCLDIEVTSLVAVLSVVGLAFSLALQNFLSNIAGGMQLLASHPFKLGDFVDAGGCSGTVTEIGMFYTKLTTPDNKLVQLPNSTIVSANIINYSAQPTRRVELKVSASYDAPTDQVIALLKGMAVDHPLALAEPEPAVHVDSYGDNAIGYVMRVWCANADYWTVYFDLMDGMKSAFDQAGIEMTYPHLNVHMIRSE